MAIKSILKPEGSIGLGIATAIFVYAIYDHSLPATAVVHATDPLDGNIDAARKKASWTAAGGVSLVTLLTKDVNILILGGVTLFALDMHARHANASDNVTGDLVAPAPGYVTTAQPGQLRSVS
jgi:hypothetical protein